VIFEVKDIRVHYGRVEALKGVSLSLDREGSIVAIIGANGAGKSTLLKAISGLKKVTSGEIWLQEERIDKLQIKDILARGIATVPEGRKLFPHMNVYENLVMGAYLREDRQGIKEDFEKVYQYFPVLKQRNYQTAGSLSGGEQQMLAIGRALMTRPKMLQLDEPSLGLSPILTEEVARIIQEISKNGVSTLLVEQNAYLALEISQKGFVLELGKVALQGEAVKLLKDEHVKKAYLGG
jgi:branched-chain amino acid transport system ATP-binding protein